MRVVVLIAGIIWCSEVSAQTPSWTIQPNICVAQRVGDECLLTFSINTQYMPSEQLCLYLDGELLSCSKQAYFYKEISVRIKKKARLELKNKEQKTVLSKTLLIKYRESNERRRIRPPWSLF